MGDLDRDALAAALGIFIGIPILSLLVAYFAALGWTTGRLVAFRWFAGKFPRGG